MISGLHYLRNYGCDKCIGFALLGGRDGGIALLETSMSPYFDHRRHRMVKAISDRMLKLAISKWECGFWSPPVEEDEPPPEPIGQEDGYDG